MDFDEIKKAIQQTFNTVAEGYDRPALQFFPASAAHLTRYLAPKPGERILDVATGTGNVALSIATSEPEARITGIDFSENMLEQAMHKARQARLDNINFKAVEMPELAFDDHGFDAASCGFGIFFLDDMTSGMHAIRKKLVSRGRLVISSFHEGSFSPLSDLFANRIANYGLEPPKNGWQRLCTQESMHTLFEESGFTQVKTFVEDVSFHMQGAEQWWELLWNAGYRGLINQLSEEDLIQFKREHLEEVNKHTSDVGLLIHINVLFGVGMSQ